MTPVFRHGRLRLYLLKLLDEAPRHGYEVIRLLQDRFMGVYAPSPVTIYPRLARLEEEGFLTHEEANGRKIYRITDKGREEINRRLGELDELEQEITESVTGIAREMKEDVRETVRSLREELTWATREVRTEDRRSAHERALQARDEAREHARQVREEMREAHTGDRDMSGEHGRQDDDAGAGRNWSDWTGWQDWTRWTEWPGRWRSCGPSSRMRSSGSVPMCSAPRSSGRPTRDPPTSAGPANQAAQGARAGRRSPLAAAANRPPEMSLARLGYKLKTTFPKRSPSSIAVKPSRALPKGSSLSMTGRTPVCSQNRSSRPS